MKHWFWGRAKKKSCFCSGGFGHWFRVLGRWNSLPVRPHFRFLKTDTVWYSFAFPFSFFRIMGDVQVSSPPLNGAVFGDDRLCSSPLSPPLPASNPDPSSIAAEAWSRAEKTTREILCRIQPTLGADQRRKEVVEYVQRLIKYSFGCEVMVPLSLLKWLFYFLNLRLLNQICLV